MKFNIGVSVATLTSSGKISVFRDRLMAFVMKGMVCSTRVCTDEVGVYQPLWIFLMLSGYELEFE